MDLDLDQPAPAPDRQDPPAVLVVPHPVPPGLLDRFVRELTSGDAGGHTVEFAPAQDLEPAVRVGWQVGVLVRLLAHGPVSVRGVEPTVLRRVGEVLHQIESAR